MTAPVSKADFPVAHAWGFRLDEWAALPELAKASYREGVANAERVARA